MMLSHLSSVGAGSPISESHCSASSAATKVIGVEARVDPPAVGSARRVAAWAAVDFFAGARAARRCRK